MVSIFHTYLYLVSPDNFFSLAESVLVADPDQKGEPQ